MGNEASREHRSMPSRDELDRIMDQTLHQSIRLDDQFDNIHAVLLATTTFHQAINQSNSLTVYQDYVAPLIRSIDDFLADQSIRSLRQSHGQSIKLPVFDLPKDTPISSLAALASDVYSADHNSSNRDQPVCPSVGFKTDLSPAYQSCRERVELAQKYLILQSLIKQSTKASVQLIKSQLRTSSHQSYPLKQRGSVSNTPATPVNNQFISLLSKVDRARQSIDWLIRDLSINQAIQQAHEMMRILVGIQSRSQYSYPRALGVGSSSKPANRQSSGLNNITRPSLGSPISFHNHVTFTFGTPGNQSPTNRSNNIHVPFTSASLSSVNQPISTSHQASSQPQYWIEQLNQRTASLDCAAQTNELVSMLGALNGGLDDSFVVSVDNLSINLSNNQSINQSIHDSGMSARLSSLLSLAHRRSLNTSDFRRALINMINRYTTINQAIDQLQAETLELYRKSVNHSKRSSSYNQTINQSINRNQRQINQMFAESLIEKRAMRDLFKFFHQSVAQYIVTDLNQSINQSVNQSINQSINLTTLYSDLQRVDRACNNLFGSLNRSEAPPITFSLVGMMNQRTRESNQSNQHLNNPISQDVSDVSPVKVTVHYDRQRHGTIEDYADDQQSKQTKRRSNSQLINPSFDFEDDNKEIFLMKGDKPVNLLVDSPAYLMRKKSSGTRHSRSASLDQLPSFEEIARINNYKSIGQSSSSADQPRQSEFDEKEQIEEQKESLFVQSVKHPLVVRLDSTVQPLPHESDNQSVSQSVIEPVQIVSEPSRLVLPTLEEPIVHEAPVEVSEQTVSRPNSPEMITENVETVSPLPTVVQSSEHSANQSVIPIKSSHPPILPPRPSLRNLSILASPSSSQPVDQPASQLHNRANSYLNTQPATQPLSVTIPLDSTRISPPIPPRRTTQSMGAPQPVKQSDKDIDSQPNQLVQTVHQSSPSNHQSNSQSPQVIDDSFDQDVILHVEQPTHQLDSLPPVVVNSSEINPHHSINQSANISPMSRNHQSFNHSFNQSVVQSEILDDQMTYGNLSSHIEDDDHSANQDVLQISPVHQLNKQFINQMFQPPRSALVLSEIPRSIHSRLNDESVGYSMKQSLNSPVKIPIFSPVRPAQPAELASRFIHVNKQPQTQLLGEEKVLLSEQPFKQLNNQSIYSPSSINWDLSPATKQMLARANTVENIKPSNKQPVSQLHDQFKNHSAEQSVNQINAQANNQSKFTSAPTPVSHYNQILHSAARRKSFDEA